MTGNLFKNLVIVLFIFAISFSYGFIALKEQIFPYSLIKNLLESSDESSNYVSVEKAAKDKFWAEEIIKGGYILHFRHAQREKWTDVTAFDAWELSKEIKAENSSFDKAVCLTDQGDEEAKLIGNIFKLTKVKIHKVVSSPSCRARETAILAFGKIDAISNSLLHRTAMTVEQHLPMTLKLRNIIENLEIKAGSNSILSGHGGTLSNYIDVLIDVNHVGKLDDRDETGFIILEKKDGEIIAHHKYKSIWHFANSIIEFPIN